jgi:hypothetical protein
LRRRKQPPNEAKTTWSDDLKPPTGGGRENMPTPDIVFATREGLGYSLVLGLEVRVGPSTQATLLGKKDTTIESLYLSPVLLSRIGRVPDCLTGEPTLSLFADV